MRVLIVFFGWGWHADVWAFCAMDKHCGAEVGPCWWWGGLRAALWPFFTTLELRASFLALRGWNANSLPCLKSIFTADFFSFPKQLAGGLQRQTAHLPHPPSWHFLGHHRVLDNGFCESHAWAPAGHPLTFTKPGFGVPPTGTDPESLTDSVDRWHQDDGRIRKVFYCRYLYLRIWLPAISHLDGKPAVSLTFPHEVY